MRETQRMKRREGKGYFDYTMLFIVLFLLGFGLVMVYSTSSYTSALENNGDGLYYLKKQLLSTVVGIIAMIFTANFPYQLYRKLSWLAYIVSIISLLLILTPLGITRKGATRWLGVQGIPITVQPAEIAKIGIIIFTAALIIQMKGAIRTWKGFIIIMLPTLPIVAMVALITDNFSSAIIIFGITFFMIFVASPDYGKYIVMVTGGLATLALVVLSILKGWTTELFGFRSFRVLAWQNPEAYADGTGFQILQSLYGIGSGGIWGKGLGKSMQKLGFLPEAENDMIFSIICEELGLFGGIAIILMFVLLLWRLVIAASNAKDLFGTLLVVGVFSHFAIQVILNIAVVTNTMPNTGISLPFISYGGTAVVFLLAEIGIVMNVTKNSGKWQEAA